MSEAGDQLATILRLVDDYLANKRPHALVQDVRDEIERALRQYEEDRQ